MHSVVMHTQVHKQTHTPSCVTLNGMCTLMIGHDHMCLNMMCAHACVRVHFRDVLVIPIAKGDRGSTCTGVL